MRQLEKSGVLLKKKTEKVSKEFFLTKIEIKKKMPRMLYNMYIIYNLKLYNLECYQNKYVKLREHGGGLQ